MVQPAQLWWAEAMANAKAFDADAMANTKEFHDAVEGTKFDGQLGRR